MGLIIIGVCITFDFARSCIFVSISIYGAFIPVADRPVFDEKHAASFLKSANIRLKEICDKWDEYISSEARRINGKSIETFDELKEDMMLIGTKQMETCSSIEELLSDAYDDFKRYKVQHDDQIVIDNYLIFISNCFQLIRDLTMTFAFGDVEVQNRYQLSQTSVHISNELTRNYKNSDLGRIIMRRKEKSEQILRNRANIADYKEDLLGIKESLEADSARREELIAEQKRDNETKNLVPSMLHDLAEKEQHMLTERIEFLNARRQQLQEKAENIREEAGSLKMGKKHARMGLLILANDYEKLAVKTEERILKTQEEISEVADTAEVQYREYLRNSSKAGPQICQIERRLSSSADRVDQLLKKIEKAEKKEITLAEEYADIMADWPDMDFSYEENA